MCLYSQLDDLFIQLIYCLRRRGRGLFTLSREERFDTLLIGRMWMISLEGGQKLIWDICVCVCVFSKYCVLIVQL